MNILVLSDSLALPRDNPQVVLYEQTWVGLLREHFAAQKYNVIQTSIGGASSREIYNQSAYMKMFRPDVVFIQVGIVDCAPRVLSYKENFVYNYFWFSRKILERILPKYGVWLRKKRKITYVSPQDFRRNLEATLDFLKGSKVFAIGIVEANAEYENALPGIQARVRQYNGILREVFGDANYIDTSGLPNVGVMTDHHHLNTEGHRYVFELACSALKV